MHCVLYGRKNDTTFSFNLQRVKYCSSHVVSVTPTRSSLYFIRPCCLCFPFQNRFDICLSLCECLIFLFLFCGSYLCVCACDLWYLCQPEFLVFKPSVAQNPSSALTQVLNSGSSFKFSLLIVFFPTLLQLRHSPKPFTVCCRVLL